MEDLLLSSRESGSQPAGQLLGGLREEGSAPSPAPPPRAGSQQQLPGLLVCPQEDEASQADGCHPWDNTCEQAEGRGKEL